MVKEGPYYIGIDILFIPGILERFCDAYLNKKMVVVNTIPEQDFFAETQVHRDPNAPIPDDKE